MKPWLSIGGLAALTAVALGAFGAHGLKGHLAPEMLTIFETGVRYQMYHALALLLLAALADRLPAAPVRWAGLSFVVGITIFSGSLYALSLTGIRWLGAITPLGGVSLLIGWIALIRGAMADPRGRS